MNSVKVADSINIEKCIYINVDVSGTVMLITDTL
jgi:uncharacterized protein YuzE